MMDIIYKSKCIDRIFDDENIANAIKYLKTKGDKAGEDGVKPSMLEEYWADNKETIINAVNMCKYESRIAYQYTELSKKGKKRTISVLNVPDKMIARAVSQVLSVEIDSLFINTCYAYRKGLGTKDIAMFAKHQAQSGDVWVAETDIQDFFDSIPHDKLLKKLETVIHEKELISLLRNLIIFKVDNEEEVFNLKRGLLQGNAISPLLSNIYLHTLDTQMSELYPGYCRYGDDIRIFTATKSEAENALATVISKIEAEGLIIRKSKNGVFEAVDRPYFGYELIPKSGQIIIQRINKESNKEIYHLWQKSSVKEIDHNYHIVRDGILTKKDFTILFENSDGKSYIPVETTDSLNIYSNIIFSSNFFELANNEGFAVNIVDKTGNYIGRFIPDSWGRNYKVEKAQISLLNDEKEHLKIAIVMQYANVFNVRASLRYYSRKDGDAEIREAVDEITAILDKIKEAKSIDSLFMHEAKARQIYYQCFNLVMPDDSFEFIKRTRRPPKDALNAMISFGNTLLYTRFANEIYRSSLDIRFGIIHNSERRPESLNLDLADLFKPILVDRTIFSLVNKRMINEIADFEEVDNKGIYLSARGKRIFLKEFERKLETVVDYGNAKKSYSELIHLEVKKLESYFRSGAKYKPFKYVK